MQDDDTANPGMLWVLDGEALWSRKAGAAGRACADCHGDARASMKGVAARYPAFDATRGAAGQPRAAHQHLPHRAAAGAAARLREPGAARADRLRRAPVARPADRRRDRRPRRSRSSTPAAPLFQRRQGQLNLACAQCHDDNWGRQLAGNVDPAGAPDRLSALPAGMAGPRLAPAAAAQLPGRHARRALRVRRARARRARALPDVARARDDDRDARPCGHSATSAPGMRRSENSHPTRTLARNMRDTTSLYRSRGTRKSGLPLTRSWDLTEWPDGGDGHGSIGWRYAASSMRWCGLLRTKVARRNDGRPTVRVSLGRLTACDQGTSGQAARPPPVSSVTVAKPVVKDIMEFRQFNSATPNCRLVSGRDRGSHRSRLLYARPRETGTPVKGRWGIGLTRSRHGREEKIWLLGPIPPGRAGNGNSGERTMGSGINDR